MNDVSKRVTGAFDVIAWKEELLGVNPWARGLVVEDTADFRAVRDKAAEQRRQLGYEAWNKWANASLKLQAKLEAARRWGTGGELTNYWLHLSSVHFGGRTFEEETSFKDFIFPGAAWFGKTTFKGAVWFDRAVFSSVDFYSTNFLSTAFFQETNFLQTARFFEATFSETAIFTGAKFGPEYYPTMIDSVNFKGRTLMNKVRFRCPVIFTGSKFDGQAGLDESIFERRAVFDGIDSRAAFSLGSAQFWEVPSFIGATFRSTLRLDNVKTPRYAILGWSDDKDAPARFRELKRRAAEAQDHDSELEFFAQEVRTSRFRGERPLSFVPRVWEWRFWFGLLYGTLSDFGRSLWRPMLAWVVLFTGFAVFYLGENPDMRKVRAVGTLSAYSEMAYLVREAPNRVGKPGRSARKSSGSFFRVGQGKSLIGQCWSIPLRGTTATGRA